MGMIALKDGEILYVNNQSDILEIIEEKCGNEFKRVVEHELIDTDKIFGFYTEMESIINEFTSSEVAENAENADNPVYNTLVSLLNKLDTFQGKFAEFFFDYDYDSFKDKI